MRFAFAFLAVALGYISATLIDPYNISIFFERTRWDAAPVYVLIVACWAVWAVIFAVVRFFACIVIARFFERSFSRNFNL